MNRIEQFYINWTTNLDSYLKDYLYNPQGKKLKPRSIYKQLIQYLHKLLEDTLPPHEKIILLPGLRGVGKTTLLAQIYYSPPLMNSTQRSTYRLYVSTDRLKAAGISLFEFYDFLKATVFPQHKGEKILLLIDEIQYDPHWALFLKIVYDENVNNKNLLVFATGSAALLLNTQNQDLVRRSITHRILPETFPEFLRIHKGIRIPTGLSTRLTSVLLSSQNAQQAYNRLLKLRPHIIQYLQKIPKYSQVIKEFLSKGSLPFSAELPYALALEKIQEMVLINIVQKDILQFGRFEANVIVKIPDLLYLLATSDEVTTGNLAETLNLSKNTINKILDTLEKAELLVELRPYGRPYTQIRKSSKFLFITPNIRAALLQGLVNGNKGKLLEDYFGFIFTTTLTNKARLLHDYSKRSADFIIRFTNNKEIVVETGFNKESIEQVINTMKRTEERAKYGLIIGSKELVIIPDKNIVKVPLEYALFM